MLEALVASFVGAATLAPWPATVLAAEAPAPTFALPLDCEPGETCWIVNYVDNDPSPERRDYRCGWLTYDGHKGTDFAIRDLGAMRKGVSVLAAAPGVVIGTRDEMRDVDVNEIGGPAALKGKDCGNGVRIAHDGDWFTQYCHVRLGSVAVRRGQRVAAGDKLGLVGLSGATEFPHVHLEVTRGRTVVDPFVGETPGQACGPGPAPLWRKDVLARLAYRSALLNNAGFASARPTERGVREGLFRENVLSRRSPVLYLWVDIYWPRPGDDLEIRITAPDGQTVLDYRKRLTIRKPRDFYFAGRPKPGILWEEGAFVGEIRLVREKGPAGREEYTLRREVTFR